MGSQEVLPITKITKMPRWRLMEQFDAIAEREPVWPGDLISKKHTKILEDAGLVMRDDDGMFVLSPNGRHIYRFWRMLPETY